MSDARDYKRSKQAWELAGRQHGVVTRRQLLALGFDTRSIEHRLARGRLHPVMRGVYVVGWPRLTPERRWMAATLACGDGAVLSHRSAAALWEIGTENPGRIDVSVMRRCRLLRPGLHIRSRPTLTPHSILSRSGIPVTGPSQTLVDLATELPPLLGLVVETDGLRYHRTPSAQARDAQRDRTHLLAGMSPLRFTHYEIKYEPAHVRTTLAKAATLLGKPCEL